MKKLLKWKYLIVITVFGVAVFLAIVNFPFRDNSTIPENNLETISTRYGIRIDSMIVIEDIVAPGQSFGTLLSQFGIDAISIDKLAKKSIGIFDLRRLKAGNNYSVFLSTDSVLEYFVYEESLADYIIFDFRDSLHIHRGQKDIVKDTVAVSCVVETSLWEALISSGIDPVIALDLSEIYAWTVDFYGLQKGDAFRIIYERLSLNSIPIGNGQIFAASYSQGNRLLYAFHYIQDSTGEYFDEKARSLRRSFLKAPLRYSRISSAFSHSRLHPVLRIRRPHHGVDYAAPKGTPVQSIGNGIVEKAGYSGGAGKMIRIKHNSVYSTAYLHLSGFGKGIRKGSRVKQGEVIGYVGSTGLSTGPHLDFRFYKNGHPIDPLKVESPPADPVKKSNLQAYFLYIHKLKARLDAIESSAKPITKADRN